VTCVNIGGGVIVTRASDRFLRRRIIHCPFCERRQEMVVRHEPWYGQTTMCTGCGDSWQDGELGWRPFKRNWRKEAVARHRALWDRATYGPDPTFDELYPKEPASGVSITQGEQESG